jgi:hypothetical protein
MPFPRFVKDFGRLAVFAGFAGSAGLVPTLSVGIEWVGDTESRMPERFSSSAS